MGEKEAERWLSTSEGKVGVISNYRNGRQSKAAISCLARADVWGCRVNHYVPRSEIDGEPAAFLTVQATGLQGESELRSLTQVVRTEAQLLSESNRSQFELNDREAQPSI